MLFRSKTTTKQENRKPLVFPLCVLRRRINARTRRSVLRQGARSLKRVRYGRPRFGGCVRSRWRAASDTPCPNSRPLRSPLSRAAFAVPRPEAEASCARTDTESGSVMGNLISPAAPVGTLAGTTSLVTSRLRCCDHALDIPRTRIVPIAYRVNRFMMHLLLANDCPSAGAASYIPYIPDLPVLSTSIFRRNDLLLPPCDRLATSSCFATPRATKGSCIRFPPSRKSVCQESSRRPP